MDRPRRWVVLRCSPASTVPLCDELARLGVTAWTPTALPTVRLPRRRIKRTLDKRAPLLPCYIFAALDDLSELKRLAADVGGSILIDFSILVRPDGQTALVADSQLEPLRAMEARMERKQVPSGERPIFSPGSAVAVKDDGAWAGMSGIVQRADDKWVLVCFGGRIHVKIDGLQLREVEAESDQPMGTAALKAA